MDILLLPNVLSNLIIEKIAHMVIMRRHCILLKEILPPETNCRRKV